MKPRSLIFSAILFTSLSASGGNFPGHRGAQFNGTASEPQPTLPDTFSPTENVAWKTDLPGPSSATPCVWGDHVFVTAAVKETKKLHAIALQRTTGKILWSKPLADGFALDDKSNMASPSPTTDGKTVLFFFGSGDLFALDFQGQQKWHVDLLEGSKNYFSFLWTFSSSPTIDDGKIYLQVLQRDVPFKQFGLQRGDPDTKDIPSYVAALDLATGEELYRVTRPSDAVAESREAFTSPTPVTIGERRSILIAGGDDLTLHNESDGQEIWRWGTWNPNRIGHWRLVPSPVTGDGIALVCAPKKAPIYAVDLETGKLAWKSEEAEISSDVCTPLFYKGHFYILNGERKQKHLSCVEPKTGKILWTGDLETRAKIECSPIACDDKIYFTDHNGTIFVISASTEKYELLHRTEFGSKKVKKLRAGIVPAHGNLFVRTHDALFCLGKN